MAAAIGAGIPVSDPDGYVVVDIGGGTTEIGVTSLGGLVLSKSIKVAGDKFDKSIIEYVRHNYNLFIGERTAEQIKLEIGTSIKLDPELKIIVKGRDSSGLLSTIELGSEGVRAAIKEPLKEIGTAVRSVLENMPPDLAGDVVDNGIILTGGGALIRGLDAYLADIVKLPVSVAEEPLLAVAYGTSKVLDEEALLRLISNE
jgi:rod shape-determining protein MreB